MEPHTRGGRIENEVREVSEYEVTRIKMLRWCPRTASYIFDLAMCKRLLLCKGLGVQFVREQPVHPSTEPDDKPLSSEPETGEPDRT